MNVDFSFSDFKLYLKTLRHKIETSRINSNEPLKKDEYFLSKRTILNIYDEEFDIEPVHQQYLSNKSMVFLIMDQVRDLEELKILVRKNRDCDGIIYKSSHSGVLRCWIKNFTDLELVKGFKIEEIMEAKDDDFRNLFSKKLSEYSRKIKD